MPLGISRLCVLSDYIQIHCRLALNAMSFRLRYSYNTTASKKFHFVLHRFRCGDTVNGYKQPIFA
jgi:hypothetical protein